MAEIDITYDRPSRRYSPGEVVSGTATIFIDEPLTVKKVTISFVGEAHVSPSLTIKATRGAAASTLATQLYFNIRPLFGRLNGPIRESVMPHDRHAFRFSFTIPTKRSNGSMLPNSYYSDLTYLLIHTAKSSCIRYFVEVHVARPAFSFDKDKEKEFAIAAVYDLNENPAAPLPGAVSYSETICCWCCASGPIEVTATLPKTGYALGEHIGVWAEIVNKSRKSVRRVIVRLMQVCTFHNVIYPWVKGQEMTCLIQSSKNQPLLPGQTQRLVNEGFAVPLETQPSTSSDDETFRIIDFSHQVEIEVVMKGTLSDFTVLAPVIIGTVPLATQTSRSGFGNAAT